MPCRVVVVVIGVVVGRGGCGVGGRDDGGGGCDCYGRRHGIYSDHKGTRILINVTSICIMP